MNEITPVKQQRRDLKEALLDPDMQAVFGALVPRHMTADRMLRLSIACITRTPKLLEVPQVQMLGALVQCAGIGLEPNSPLQHVHLIPFENRAKKRYDLQVIIGYRGFVELGRRTGKQRWVHADVVRPGDEFEYTYGNDAHLRHRPGRGAAERQAPTEAYCFVQLDDGFAFVVLPEWEILRHRDHSFAWRQEKEKSIWAQHADRMWRKTAIRVLYSGGEVPLDTELAMAVATDDRSMDYRAMGELAMKGGKDAIEHLKEGMDTFVAEQEDEPESGEEPQPELKSQVRRAGQQQIVPDRQSDSLPPCTCGAKEGEEHHIACERLIEAKRRGLADQNAGQGHRPPRDIPKTSPGRPIERTPERQVAGAPPQDVGYSAASPEPSRRTRRSYEQIKADLIQDIRNAHSVEEVDAVLESRDYANRSPEMKAEIDAEAETMINALREADPQTGEIGPDPDRGNLDDRGSMSDIPEDFDRGEPREEVVPDRHAKLHTDKTEAGAVTAAPAATYKLIGLAGTLIEMLPAGEWFDELEERIGQTSLGMRQTWLTVNQGTIQEILRARPDLHERLQDAVAKTREVE